MGYVSKFENDQERLYEAATSGALSFTNVPKSELEKTKLKFEIENLQKFVALVRCTLATAKIQIRELEKQNTELKDEVISLLEKLQDTSAKSNEQIRAAEAAHKAKADSILCEKRKQFESLISELDKYRFAEFKRLYEQQTSPLNAADLEVGECKAQKGACSTGLEVLPMNPVLPSGFDL